MTCTAVTMSDVRWATQQTTAPTAEPITVEEVRAHSVIDDTEEDAVLIETYIAAARWMAELICDRQIMPATWKLYLDAFPGEIRLPKPRAQSVTSITYADASNVTQTLSTSVYGLDSIGEPGRVYLKYGQSWPATYDVPNAVCVTYVAGYGSSNALALAALPKQLKLGMLHLVAHWFENREPVNIGNIVNPLPSMGEQLIRSAWHGYLW